jgi:HEAT repeat.
MKKYVLVIMTMLTVILLGCSSKQSNPQIEAMTPIETAISPPPMELLGHGARLPTAEELEQEKIFDAQRVAQAIENLKSTDVHQRIVATETLNAYQTPESERQLADTLLSDDNAKVRQTAAQSLALFKVLSDCAVKGLFKALYDKDEQTRKESLDTLLSYIVRLGDSNDKFFDRATKNSPLSPFESAYSC